MPPRFASHYAAAREAWPDLELDEALFADHVGAVSPDAPPPLERSADLYLACACAHGVRGAVEAFERAHGGDLARAVARISSDPAFVADATQVARERILVRTGATPPRIAEYAGRAPLRAWLTAAALRVALNMRRRKSDEPHDTLTSAVAAAVDVSPELAVLRRRFKAPFEAAIRAAIPRLPPRERALLRLHLVERMSIDALGEMYRVSRATAARWLASARGALVDETRRQFQGEHGVTDSEFESIAAALQSELDVSLAAHLAAE